MRKIMILVLALMVSLSMVGCNKVGLEEEEIVIGDVEFVKYYASAHSRNAFIDIWYKSGDKILRKRHSASYYVKIEIIISKRMPAVTIRGNLIRLYLLSIDQYK